MSETFSEKVVEIYKEKGMQGILENSLDFGGTDLTEDGILRREITITLELKDIFFLALLYLSGEFLKKVGSRAGERFADWTLDNLADFVKNRRGKLCNFFGRMGFEKRKEELAEQMIKEVTEAARKVSQWTGKK